MRQLTRLVRYVLPYWLQICLGAAAGRSRSSRRFQYLLVRPVLDRVLNPASGSRNILLFTIPGTHHAVYLQQFVPVAFHNAWTIVAFALVASTILKGICDYAGTYLVNHAGFGMITDLRDDLYNAILRRSAAFFRSTPRAHCFRPSSTTSSACSTPCRPCWPSSCSSSLPFCSLRAWS